MKIYLIAFALLTTGLIAGLVISSNSDVELALSDSVSRAQQDVTGQSGSLGDGTVDADPLARIGELEVELADMKARLKRIEETRIVPGESGRTLASLRPQNPAAEGAAANAQPLPTLDALMASGIDPVTAEEITVKQSSIQLARLELRDKAIREGYIGTPQYREELGALREAETRIRDEVDETAYDKYLFHTGQTNRVTVESVILGSTAEVNGIQTGDMILRYEDKPLYNFRDLRSATTAGEKDEWVDVTVQRGDTRLVVSLPRGPLGVRLNSLRVDPEDS